ncbi:MAG: hypothetical protein ISS36_00100 [Candidatus Aenigmarchaeota archaeon]|nr:hypothetical protein [Candidatus Aenigmarchaeota archaeon]
MPGKDLAPLSMLGYPDSIRDYIDMAAERGKTPEDIFFENKIEEDNFGEAETVYESRTVRGKYIVLRVSITSPTVKLPRGQFVTKPGEYMGVHDFFTFDLYDFNFTRRAGTDLDIHRKVTLAIDDSGVNDFTHYDPRLDEEISEVVEKTMDVDIREGNRLALRKMVQLWLTR